MIPRVAHCGSGCQPHPERINGFPKPPLGGFLIKKRGGDSSPLSR